MTARTGRLLAALVLLAAVAAGCGDDSGGGGGGGSEGGGGSTLRVPDDYGTIQDAVDAASPGDLILISPGTYEEEVNVTTDNLVLRGLDRAGVVLEGGFEKENGVRVLEADGVAVENMTAQNYTGNGFFWTGVDGYRGSYLTAIRNGDYGIYAFASQNGLFEHSYASGSPDAGYYIGQCSDCNAVIDDVIGEWNGLGYSGTNSGGDLYIINSEFHDNRAGIVPNSQTTEGCAPQREATIAGNWVHDNNNAETDAIGAALQGQGNGILVTGGNANVVEKNLVEGQDISGIAVVPRPEDDPIIDVPAETPPDCVADVSPLPDDEIAQLDNPLIWPIADNQVVDNVVTGSGEWDIAIVTLDGESHGNCFSGNDAAVTAPPDVDTVLPCDGQAQTFEPETARFLELASVERPEPTSYEDVDLPDPGDQPNMPDAETAPAEPAGPPPAVDLDSITVPTGG